MQKLVFHFSNGETLTTETDGYTVSGNNIITYNEEKQDSPILSTGAAKQKVVGLIPLSLVLWIDFLE